MCEILAAAFDTPHPFADLVESTAALETYGLGSFGWGVAWLGDNGEIELRRDTGRFVDQGAADGELTRQVSRRFLVHLRRPSRLSTIQLADTQPFVDDNRRFAFCHNGFLEGAESQRGRFAGRLAGNADSEIGWVWFQDRLAAGEAPKAALTQVDTVFGGSVNLGYLDAGGELAVYTRSPTNAMWRFRVADGDFASTALHSDDESVFDLAFPSATDRERIEPGTTRILAEAVPSAARG